jgi:pyruvate dehydrogenase (quinone)
MSTQTVADFLLNRLREWGVETVFAYPGDGINGLLAAFVKAENRPEFVQSRHEEMSAFEAVGYAKFTGRVGVCMATSGPGAIHLLNGLYDAKLDHVPVVAIVGQTDRSAMGGSYQQEVDLHTLFQDVTDGQGPDGDRARTAAQRARPGDAVGRCWALPDGAGRPRRRPGAGLFRAEP